MKCTSMNRYIVKTSKMLRIFISSHFASFIFMFLNCSLNKILNAFFYIMRNSLKILLYKEFTGFVQNFLIKGCTTNKV